MADDRTYDDEPCCPICGSYQFWEDCPECEDGYVDDYEDDPEWFDHGDISACRLCDGRGGWWQCAALPHSEQQVAEYRVRTGETQ